MNITLINPYELGRQPFGVAQPAAWLRDAGMLALDICPPAKRWFGHLTMGRAGRLPRLARGLEL